MKKNSGRLLIAFLVVCWVALVASGMKVLVDYSRTPGTAGKPSARWPGQLVPAPKSGRPTLVMFAHPKCPCSQASVDELDVLSARSKLKAQTYVVFVRPVGWPEKNVSSALWNQASAIPGVQVLMDNEGVEARRFGAETSGHVFLYDGSGNLVFSGGITGSRGHAGDNASLDAAVAYLQTGVLPRKTARIFGCSLFNIHTRERTI